MSVCLSHSYEDGDPVSVRSRHVRPRARHKLSLADLTPGSRVMVNYNYDEPRRRGYWYDAVVTDKQVTRTNRQLTATVYIGYDSDSSLPLSTLGMTQPVSVCLSVCHTTMTSLADMVTRTMPSSPASMSTDQRRIQEFALGGLPPFPSTPLSTLLFLPLPLRSGVPLKPASGSGERCKLLQRGPGQSSGRKRIWCTLKL